MFSYYPNSNKTLLPDPDGDFDFASLPTRSADDLANLREAKAAKVRASLFYRHAIPWLRLGFNIVPGDGTSKKPLVAWGIYKGEGCERVTEAQLYAWAQEHPDAPPYLILGSGLHFGLVVIDCDAPGTMEWAVRQYGDTPLRVYSGRGDGCGHLYYLTEPGVHVAHADGQIGSEEGICWSYTLEPDPKVGYRVVKAKKDKALGVTPWGRTPIDVKAHTSYVVAAGALHKSGRAYQSSIPTEELSVEWCLEHLPRFDVQQYEWDKQEGRERRARKDAEIQAALKVAREAWRAKLPAKERAQIDLACGDAVEGLVSEPFLKWCEEDPESLNLQTWWGLASNLAALRGDAGRAEFHRISALGSSYDEVEADYTWIKAVNSLSTYGPMGYAALRRAGYTGAIPTGAKSPAAFVRRQAVVAPPEPEPVPEEAVATPRAPAHDPDWTPEDEARSAAIRGLRDHYAEDVQLKQEVADGMDSQLVQAAQRAARAAKDWSVAIRKSWREHGLHHRGKHCGKIRQALTNISNGQLAAMAHGCDRLSCILCGPIAAARQAGAILHLPVTAPSGEIVGASLSTRPVWRIDVPAASARTWMRKFNRAVVPPECLISALRDPKGCKAEMRHSAHGKDIYVMFVPEGAATVTFLMTAPVSGGRTKGVTEPVQIPSDELQDVVLGLVTATYQIDSEGMNKLLPVLTGKITSARGLTLDPDRLLRLANPTCWRVEETHIVEPKEARRLAVEAGYVTRQREDAEGVLTSVTIPQTLTDSERYEVIANWKKGEAPDPKAVSIAVAPTASELRETNELLDQIEAGVIPCLPCAEDGVEQPTGKAGGVR